MKADNVVALEAGGAASVPAPSPRRKASKPPALPAPQRPETLMQAIIQASADPTVDVGKIGALVQLHQEMQSREWQRAFNEAMVACQAELAPVARNQVNPQTNSRYADLAALAEHALPIINKHFAVTLTETATEKAGCIGIAVSIRHREGHVERCEFHIPTDAVGFKGTPNKSAVHAYGSALTYARRYALLSAFNIVVAGDDDGNAAGVPRKSSAQLKREGEWPRFEAEMRACQSMAALEKVWRRWQARMNFWTHAWRESAVNLKETCKEALGGTIQALKESAEALESERWQAAMAEDAREATFADLVQRDAGAPWR